ncbi:MAG: hypothetical protein WEB04_06885 [Dehalococcoidia bacterium]
MSLLLDCAGDTSTALASLSTLLAVRAGRYGGRALAASVALGAAGQETAVAAPNGADGFALTFLRHSGSHFLQYVLVH